MKMYYSLLETSTGKYYGTVKLQQDPGVSLVGPSESRLKMIMT